MGNKTDLPVILQDARVIQKKWQVAILKTNYPEKLLLLITCYKICHLQVTVHSAETDLLWEPSGNINEINIFFIAVI